MDELYLFTPEAITELPGGSVVKGLSQLGMTCGNPCPVVDRATGVIWLPFCKNLADGDEDLITVDQALAQVKQLGGASTTLREATGG